MHFYVVIIRILILFAIIFIVLVMIRRLFSGSQGKTAKIRDRSSSTVKCAYCQVYILKEEAIKSNNNYYCTLEHKNMALSNPD